MFEAEPFQAPVSEVASDSEIDEITEITPEMFKIGYSEASIEKSPRVLSNSGSFLNTTQDESSNDESPCKFTGSRLCSSPAKVLEGSDEEIDQAGAESDDLDVSLSSLGLDFV